MSEYRVREATIGDLDAIVHHRIAMFTDMGTTFDAPVVTEMFRSWAAERLRSGDYRAWVSETADGTVVAGGGITLLPWPPGPSTLPGGRIAFVYNVYVEPAHRKRGLARSVMEAIHAWCRTHGIPALALNAAPAARHLYESMGYVDAPSAMMWKIV